MAAPDTPAREKPDPVRQLLDVAREAFAQNPGNCSGAVHYVITHLVDPSARYYQANELTRVLGLPGSGWVPVQSMGEASGLANQGRLVVAGLADDRPGHSGHVVVILPGAWKRSGGFALDGGKIMPEGEDTSPPVMSTSASHYPGAVSNGDKTLYDAWPRAFHHKISFWTPQVP